MKKGGEGGVRAAVGKKSCVFFFHSWLVLALLLWCFYILPVLSFNSLTTEKRKKIEPPNSVQDRWTSQYTQTDSYLPLEETLVFSQW